MPAQDLARSHVNQSVSGPDLEALRSLWFACLSDSTDVMAMLQCFAVAQQESLGAWLSHLSPRVHQACLVFLTPRPKWFSHLS